MNPRYHGFWLLLYEWQTLVAGFLAIVAAVGTVWATIRSANREIEAANRQIETARKQIVITLSLDRRRTAHETHTFLIALETAANIVIENIEAARAMVPRGPNSNSYSAEVYHARQRVPCPLFPDLRPACVKLGGHLTVLFARLDQDIAAFAMDWIPAQSVGGMDFRTSRTEGFHDGLDQLAGQAHLLRTEAQIFLKVCSEQLRDLDQID